MSFEETTFRTEAAYWLGHRAQTVSPGYFKKAKAVVAEFDEAFGHLAPNRLHPGFIAELQKSELGKSLRFTTVNHKIQIITAILNFSVRSRRIPFNPAAGLQKLKGSRAAMRFWEKWEAEAFLSFADKKYPFGSPKRWVYVAYLTSINTAIRAGELLGMQPRDIVQDGEMIHIQRQFRPGCTCVPRAQKQADEICALQPRAKNRVGCDHQAARGFGSRANFLPRTGPAHLA